MTAAYIVERLSGVRFSNYVQENIINRLPFSSATYNVTKAKLSGNLADAFVRVKRNVPSGGLGWSKSVYEPTDFIIDSEVENIVAGPGGVIMSARDAVGFPSSFWDFILITNFEGHMASNFTVVWEAPRDSRLRHPS